MHADDHVAFSGTVTSLVYTHDGASATVARVEHRAPNLWRLWYVAPADAYGRLILSNETLAYQYEPKSAKVYSNDWAALAPFAEFDISRVRRNYSVETAEHASVAGRPAVTVSLISNYSHALALRLWLDASTDLILRRETYRADGTIETKTSFDNIRYVSDLPNDLFKMTVPAGMTLIPGTQYGKSTTDLNALTSGLSFKALAPRQLSDGFAFDKGSTDMRGGVQIVQLVYSDGLRSVSLFENSSQKVTTFDAPSAKIAVGKQNGTYATVAGQSVVSWNQDGLNLTLVGDLTPKALSQMGAAISQ